MFLTVPNWSFGRDRRLLGEVRDRIASTGLTIHYADADVDHNRSVTAFSGPRNLVLSTLFDLAEMILPSIDLQRHQGVHPRIGALDVCPFVISADEPEEPAIWAVESFAEEFARRFEIPVYLYEKSERGRHSRDLPELRRGGYGGMVGRRLEPDFGPPQMHPQWGVTVVGIRPFLLALNVNLKTENLGLARDLARQIRQQRELGDPRFLGVRALGFPLASRECVQVSLNVTLPDLVSPDPIVEWIAEEAKKLGVTILATELIGVIRVRDLERSERFPIRPEQVVEF